MIFLQLRSIRTVSVLKPLENVPSFSYNKTVTSVNVNNSIPARYAEYFNDRQTVDYYRLIHFKDYEVEDLAMLSLQYSFDTVIYALSSIYKTYILKEHEIKNLGGLVRTAIMAQLKTSYQAA